MILESKQSKPAADEYDFEIPPPAELSFYPPEEVRKILASIPEIPIQITGLSLPYLCSGRIVLVAPKTGKEAIDSLTNRLQGMGVVLKKREEFSEQIRCLFSLQEAGIDFRMDFLEEGLSTSGYRCGVSTDSLIYNIQSGEWEGSEEALQDMEQGILRMDPAEVTHAGHILEIGSLSSRLDSVIPDELVEGLRNVFQESDGAGLSRRFLQKQLTRIVTGHKPSTGFRTLNQLGALEWFLPELSRGIGLEQNRFHKYDIYTHSVFTCDAIPFPDLTLRLAGLIHDLGKVDTRKEKGNGEASFHNHEMVSAKIAERIMKRFSYPSSLGKRVRFLVRNHMFHYTNDWTDRAVRRFSSKVDPDTLEDLITLRLADRKGSGKRQSLPKAVMDLIRHIRDFRAKEAELKIRDLCVGGEDLKELGFEPGPVMGVILQNLLTRVKDGTLPNERDVLLDEIRGMPEYGNLAKS